MRAQISAACPLLSDARAAVHREGEKERDEEEEEEKWGRLRARNAAQVFRVNGKKI